MSKKYWLFKSEPGTYSFQTLLKEKETNWNGVRNFQARNFLKEAQVGDLALIYHSGTDKAVVGVAEVVRDGFPDPDPNKKGDWVQIGIRAQAELRSRVPLKMIKNDSVLKNLLLVKQFQLSVMPVSETAFKRILELGE